MNRTEFISAVVAIFAAEGHERRRRWGLADVPGVATADSVGGPHKGDGQP
jgi:hypothetical protein